MLPSGILETVLYAKDLERTQRFYHEVLGLAPFAKAEGRHLFYRCGDQVLLIFNPEATRQEVRIMFYRVVWKGDGMAGENAIPPGQQKMEMIRDPLLYQQFFAKLSKAVFLEAFTL